MKMRMNQNRQRAAVVLFLTLLMTAELLFAHGGGGGHGATHEVCAMKIGPYSMNMTLYQPGEPGEAQQPESHCGALPSLGKTFITFDFLHGDLRAMAVELFIVPTRGWFDDGGGEGLAKRALLRLPSKRYPQGLFSTQFDFTQVGHYALVVVAERDSGQRYIGHYPFSVGLRYRFIELYLLATLIPLVAFGRWLHRKKPQT